MSIGSGVYLQLTANCLKSIVFNGVGHVMPKFPLHLGESGPTPWPTQVFIPNSMSIGSANNSILSLYFTIRQDMSPKKLPLPMGYPCPHLIINNGSSDRPSPQPKWHLNRFSRLCRANGQQTDTQTDHATSTATGWVSLHSVHAMRPNKYSTLSTHGDRGGAGGWRCRRLPTNRGQSGQWQLVWRGETEM